MKNFGESLSSDIGTAIEVGVNDLLIIGLVKATKSGRCPFPGEGARGSFRRAVNRDEVVINKGCL